MTNKELIDKIKQYTLGRGGLKVHNNIDNQLQIIEMVDFCDNELILWSNDNFCHESGDRIVLRPLSLLTEEIEHNGEKFVPIHRISELFNVEIEMDSEDVFLIGKEHMLNVSHIYYNWAQLFLEWKFDVFGLIEKGYAVSTEDKSLKGIKTY